MEKEDLINKLENMHKPEMVSETHQVQLKITLLNARKSANFGIILAIIPVFFLGCIFLKYMLHLSIPAFTSFESRMSEKDKNPLFKILIPLLLIGAPLLGLAINLLAILYVEWRKNSRELLITLKIRWRNIIIIIICLLILACFLFYVVGENL
jgi:hypothetical protein